jgi:hypothetical protein
MTGRICDHERNVIMRRWTAHSDIDYYEPLRRHMGELPPLPQWTAQELRDVEALAKELQETRQAGMGEIEKRGYED